MYTIWTVDILISVENTKKEWEKEETFRIGETERNHHKNQTRVVWHEEALLTEN